MTTSLFGLCWGTLIQAELPSLIELAGRFGFPTITVPPAKFDATTQYGVGAGALRQQLRDAAVRVTMIDQVSFDLPGLDQQAKPHLPPTHQTGVDFDRCAAMAEALDCTMVNITHYRGDPATPLAQIADALGEMSHAAAARGLILTFEFIPNTAVPDCATPAALQAMVGQSQLRLVIDVWHLANSGGGAAQIDALPPGAVVAGQLSDRRSIGTERAAPPGMDRSMPGEGVLPLDDILAAIRRNNPAAVIEIEMFDSGLRPLAPSVAAARTSAAVTAWRAGKRS